MPIQQQFLSQAGALVQATERQAFLAASEMRLFKFPFQPAPATTLVALLAEECDFDGYAPAAIATWNAPVLAPGSGYMIYGPQITFTWAHVADDVGNSVGGYFIIDSNGDLADVVVYGDPKPMTGPGQAVIEVPVEIFPTTPSV